MFVKLVLLLTSPSTTNSLITGVQGVTDSRWQLQIKYTNSNSASGAVFTQTQDGGNVWELWFFSDATNRSSGVLGYRSARTGWQGLTGGWTVVAGGGAVYPPPVVTECSAADLDVAARPDPTAPPTPTPTTSVPPTPPGVSVRNPSGLPTLPQWCRTGDDATCQSACPTDGICCFGTCYYYYDPTPPPVMAPPIATPTPMPTPMPTPIFTPPTPSTVQPAIPVVTPSTPPTPATPTTPIQSTSPTPAYNDGMRVWLCAIVSGAGSSGVDGEYYPTGGNRWNYAAYARVDTPAYYMAISKSAYYGVTDRWMVGSATMFFMLIDVFFSSATTCQT
jgi:hypothetical protein